MTGAHDGCVVVITGGGNGIGAATAAIVVREGGRVVLGDVDVAAAEQRAKELGDSAALGVRLDVADQASWVDLVRVTMDRFGRIDGLVNNAGIATGHDLVDTDADEMAKVLLVNTIGPLVGIKTCLEALREAGAGSVVNVASCAALAGLRSNVAYSTSKFAIRGLTQTLVHELAGYGIRINSVFPGYVDTQLSRPHWAEQSAAGQQPANVALGRTGHPRELGELISFLLSDAASYCTGSEFVADGGLMAVVPPRDVG